MVEKKLKIAFVSFYSGTNNRGVESLVHELAGRFASSHHVVVFQEGQIQERTKYETVRTPMNINWNRRDMAGTIWRKLFTDYWSRIIGMHTIKVVPKIIKGRFDIVIPLNGGWQSAVVRFATWLYGGKMIISGQSGLGWDDRNNLWSFPDTFVALTDYQLKWSKRANPFVALEKITNGTDVSKFFRHKSKKTNIDLPGPIILVVAALTGWKRLDLAIKAVSKLSTGSLLIVGSGEQKEMLEKMGNELLQGRFKILSFPYKQMPQVYISADLFTFPTDPTESFGIVLVEAMASGLPVVATDDPIRREIVGDAGLFVDPTDTDKYTKTLRKALKTKWGDKPRRQAEKFSWDEIAKQYEKLFIKLVNG